MKGWWVGCFWPASGVLGLGQRSFLGFLLQFSIVVAVCAAASDVATATSAAAGAAASVAFCVVHALHLSHSCQVSTEPEP